MRSSAALAFLRVRNASMRARDCNDTLLVAMKQTISRSTSLQRRPALINRLQITLALERSVNISLLAQHVPISLPRADLRELSPSREVLRVSLVAVSRFRVLPMSLGEPQERRDLFIGDIIHQAADGAGLLEPVALPQLAGSNALELGGLEVFPAGHGPTVDYVDDACERNEPHLNQIMSVYNRN